LSREPAAPGLPQLSPRERSCEPTFRAMEPKLVSGGCAPLRSTPIIHEATRSAVRSSSRASTRRKAGEPGTPWLDCRPMDAVTAVGCIQGRVLVVDDEEALARVIRRTLSAAGYEVSTASDGEQATTLLSSGKFDAIVSDIGMPRMSGIQLLQAVRQRDLDVPVILMTGAPDLKTAVEAVAHGALLYLAKPVDTTELGKAVARAVRLNRMAGLKREAFILGDKGGLGALDPFALEASFERALGTLWMAYQPIVRAVDGSLFGYEALLRSEEKALPHPGAILDAAERLGRLEQLGQKIRTAACDPVAKADPLALFFVNLHARDLMDDTLLSPDAPLSSIASRVVLEVTERASLDEVKGLRGKIAALRRMGFRLAIDDLGAGYAGLTSFATLEPEFVKLDMSLVRDVDKNPMKAKLIHSMTLLCKDLGMMVVAEGVETQSERDLLVALGCDLLQGYLLAKPGRPFPSFAW
jgi:EAL domain-containing protein (putative c-di-GMP-specific phosphodiesterase class I)